MVQYYNYTIAKTKPINKMCKRILSIVVVNFI